MFQWTKFSNTNGKNEKAKLEKLMMLQKSAISKGARHIGSS